MRYLSTGILWSMCHSNTLYSEAQLRQRVFFSLRITQEISFIKITLRRPLDEKGSMLWCSQASHGHGRQPKIMRNIVYANCRSSHLLKALYQVRRGILRCGHIDVPFFSTNLKCCRQIKVTKNIFVNVFHGASQMIYFKITLLKKKSRKSLTKKSLGSSGLKSMARTPSAS